MAGRTRRPLKRVAAFWDTSALVPLFVRQSATLRVAAMYDAHDIVIWWATPVEIASALARLVRIQQITASDYAESRKLVEIVSSSWRVVQPSDGLRALANRLVDRYDLRAADALQLAAALEWCEGAPNGRTFLTADGRLRDSALISGFDVVPV